MRGRWRIKSINRVGGELNKPGSRRRPCIGEYPGRIIAKRMGDRWEGSQGGKGGRVEEKWTQEKERPRNGVS